MSLNIEEHILEAQKSGHFDNLSGKGKPLSLKQNPFAQHEQLSHDLLQNNGYSLPWIEEKREIETAVKQAITTLKRVWIRYDGTRLAAYNWREATAAFRLEIEKINRRILTFNLKAATPQLHLPMIKADKHIAEVQRY